MYYFLIRIYYPVLLPVQTVQYVRILPTTMISPILFIYIYSLCLPIQSQTSDFSTVTHFLLLQFYFITNLFSCNGIHGHTTIHTFFRNGWQIHFYVFERPGILFDSNSFIFVIYIYLFLYS